MTTTARKLLNGLDDAAITDIFDQLVDRARSKASGIFPMANPSSVTYDPNSIMCEFHDGSVIVCDADKRTIQVAV